MLGGRAPVTLHAFLDAHAATLLERGDAVQTGRQWLRDGDVELWTAMGCPTTTNEFGEVFAHQDAATAPEPILSVVACQGDACASPAQRIADSRFVCHRCAR